MAELKNIDEIRGRDSRELRLELQEHKKELFQLHFHGAAEAVAKSSRFRQIRRTVARILTVLGERDRGAEVVPVAPGSAPRSAKKPKPEQPAAEKPAKAAKPKQAEKPAKAPKAAKAEKAPKEPKAKAAKAEQAGSSKRSGKQ
jgi:large subunit ribosomal protein L29